MDGDGNFKWWWGPGRSPESCSGPFDSRDAALEDAQRECASDFTLIEADKVVPSFDVFDLYEIRERLDEENEGAWGEDGPQWTGGNEARDELLRELEAVLARWWGKHGSPTWAFGAQRSSEYFSELPRKL